MPVPKRGSAKERDGGEHAADSAAVGARPTLQRWGRGATQPPPRRHSDPGALVSSLLLHPLPHTGLMLTPRSQPSELPGGLTAPLAANSARPRARGPGRRRPQAWAQHPQASPQADSPPSASPSPQRRGACWKLTARGVTCRPPMLTGPFPCHGGPDAPETFEDTTVRGVSAGETASHRRPCLPR